MADHETASAGETPGHLRREITVGDSTVVLLGTAHVSRRSVEDVEREIASGDFEAVAVELCASRHRALTEPDGLENMDLFQVLRRGQASMVAASLALGAYQQRLAEQFEVQPGAEMRAAVTGAQRHDSALHLIDREIGTTLKRVYRNVPWWRRATILGGLGASLFSRERISEEEIERLKQGDILESTFAEFAQGSRHLYEPLITERDRYMAARLKAIIRDTSPRRLLAVVGAGHISGISEALVATDSADPANEIAQLERIPPRARWVRLLPWAVAALIVTGFVLGFSRSTGLGIRMVGDWVLINGGLSALGAAVAAAHPLTVVTAFLAAPLTSLNPTIGAGFVTAAAELALRKPQVRDFRSLRGDVTSPRGWWRNRVARVLLVFLFSTLGSAAGTYLAGFRIAGQLLG